MRTLRLATRGSSLALAQTRLVQERLKGLGVETTIQIVKTRGDQNHTSPLREIGGGGLFVREIELQLQSGQADLAVHSGKDLPFELLPGMAVEAAAEAADPRDCMIFRKDRVLGERPVIGTGSVRRISQCARLYPGAVFKEIRGNIDTRLRKLREGEYDAILLAKAGLDRLGLSLEELDVRIFEPEEFIPAACQGILAVECRRDDEEVFSLLEQMADADTRLRFALERRVFCSLPGDCSVEMGAYARIEGERVQLRAMYQGKTCVLKGTREEAWELAGKVREALVGVK